MPVVKMWFKMTEYPEVAREEMAGDGRQDVLGDGQQEQAVRVQKLRMSLIFFTPSAR